MKSQSRIAIFAILAIASQAHGQAADEGQPSEDYPVHTVEIPSKEVTKAMPGGEKKVHTGEQRKVFTHKDDVDKGLGNLGHGFSAPLGWTLWKTPGTRLCEVTTLTAPESGPDDDKFSVVYDPQDRKFKKVSLAEYSEWGLKTRLGIFADDPQNAEARQEGSVVMLSLRDSFSYFNANQEGFGFDYATSDGDSSLKIKGALMADFYLDPLYNRKDDWFGTGYPYQFWFRTGVEIDRDDTATKPFDRTSYYLLTNFQINPAQDAHLFGNESLMHIFSPQFVQLGAALDHDEFTGDNELRWIVGWQPQFYFSEDVIEGYGESFGINRIMRYKKGTFLNLLKPSEIDEAKREAKAQDPASENPASPWYSSLPMDLKLSGGSKILAAAFQNDADSADDALLEWKAGVFVGNSDWRARIGYFVEGASPVLDPGETHVGHRFVAEIGLGNISENYAEQQRSQIESLKKNDDKYENVKLSSSDLGAMTIFAEYRIGAPPPTYKKEDIFQIGTRIRF